MLQLAGLYAPIAPHLTRVSAILREELRSDQPCVQQMCRHIEHFHGKMLRPALVLLSAAAAGKMFPGHETLAAVVEIAHVASLVHDDVLDESELRRGNDTVNRRWDNERAVLLGDYLISHAFHLCSSLDSQFASRAIARTTNTVCEGEIMQVANRGNVDLDEPTYYEIITRKTASLIGACCMLGAKFSGADVDSIRRLEQYGLSLGIAFQIVDDLLDLTGNEAETGKSLGRDLQKGKLTLPLIHHLRTCGPSRRQRMLTVLRADNGAKPNISEWLAETDSVEYARDVACGHIATALDCLSHLPVTDARGSLTAMAEFVLARRQ